MLHCSQEVTQMCTPGTKDVLILGTTLGSLFLYDLKNLETTNAISNLNYVSLLEIKLEGFKQLDEYRKQKKIQLAMNRYRVIGPCFLTDGLPDYKHFSPIKSLRFVRTLNSGISQIGVLDEHGVISVWSVIQSASEQGEIGVKDYELNMMIGSNYKMAMVYHEELMSYPAVVDTVNIDSVTQSLEVEFDAQNSLVFFFTTSEGLFKMDKGTAMSAPAKLDTQHLGSPTALSISDVGFLLVAFSCGSIW